MHGRFTEQPNTGDTTGILTIDLRAVSRNYRALADRLGPARAGAVVKADAYGLGANRIVPALLEAGCRDFFVAQLQEALALKPLPTDTRLFVLNGLLPGTEAHCAHAGIVPVLNSLKQVAAWSALARATGRELSAVLQLDTGMARLGLSPADLDTLSAAPDLLHGLHLLFLMSHLASADNPDNLQNAEQLAAFSRHTACFSHAGLCIANSGGIFLGEAYHGALARPGLALYGGAPTSNQANPMQPVVRLEIPVIQTRDVPPGTRVGYSAKFVAARTTRLATIAAGYADGLPHTLSNRGAAYFGNTRLPIAGRVSMDTITLDITELPPDTLQPGSLVEIIGPHQSLEQLAADAGTISYEILTRLSPRYRRHYL